jgi:hypothetical protein
MKILIGAPVKQDEKVFQYYLESLRKLKKDNLEVDLLFVFNDSENLIKYLNDDEFFVIYNTSNKYVKDDTHNWTEKNLTDVSTMKNFLLDQTIEKGYDYFFLVDSDLILHEETLLHLLKQDKDIIGEVFWTKWNKTDEKETPNAWMYDMYSFAYLNQFESWKTKGIYEVGYTGACVLISKHAIINGANYKPIKNISYTSWEDRAFGVRASVNDINIYLDTHYPALHLYREEDVLEYEKVRSNL